MESQNIEIAYCILQVKLQAFQILYMSTHQTKDENWQYTARRETQ